MVSDFPNPQSTTTPTIGVDAFPQWFSPPYVFVIYVIMEIMACALFGFALTGATYRFPGNFLLNLIVRSVIIAGVKYFIVLMWSKLTGAFLDGPTLMLVGFCEMFFSRKRKPQTSAGFLSRFQVLGKVLIFLLSQFVGYLIGVSTWTTVIGGKIVTGNCTVDFVPSCLVKPVPMGITESGAMWSLFWGCLFIQGSYFVGWAMSKKISLWVALITKTYDHRKHGASLPADHSGDTGYYSVDPPNSLPRVHRSPTKYVPWEINDDWQGVARSVASAEFVTQLMFSSEVGTGFNFWFWFVTSIYTSDYSFANFYAWPTIASGLVVFLFQLMWYLLSSGSMTYNSTTLKNLDKVM